MTEDAPRDMSAATASRHDLVESVLVLLHLRLSRSTSLKPRFDRLVSVTLGPQYSG